MNNIWFLCPFSRPEQSSHIESIWKSNNCNLLVVDNCKTGRYEGEATHIIRTPPGCVLALNTGIKYLKDNYPDDIFARIDDDDLYSPEYAMEVFDIFEHSGCDFSAIPQHRVQLRCGDVLLFGTSKYNGGPGGTIAARVSTSEYFKDCFPTEDGRYCHDMRDKKFVKRGSDNFIRVRSESNHSVMSDDVIRLFSDFDVNHSS